MARLIVAIDQSPCRASYGLLGQQDFLRATAARQKQAVQDNIARVAADGDRLARIASRENAVVAIAAELYLSEPKKEVALVAVERPAFHLVEVTGGEINIFV